VKVSVRRKKNSVKMKSVFVTGGNTGIGEALCRILVRDHGCYVYLGSRNEERGAKAVADIKEQVGEEKGKNIEMVQIDVCSDESISAAAAYLKSKGVTLYGLVNNAGVGIKTANEADLIMTTNFYGPKKVTDALVGFVDKSEGRIVNVSSGAASMWLRDQDDKTKKLFSDPSITWEALEEAMKANVAAKNFRMGGYGLSKAGLTALTMIQAANHPSLKVTSLSPGFIATNMTAGRGAKLTPEEGCVSSIKCLFGGVTSGWYYGSDGLRSPLTVTRDPGMPEYQGEDNPDAAKYNK